MRADLERVDARVEQAATIDYPLASSLVFDIVKAGGKRLRPLMLLLAGRGYTYDLDRLVTAAAGIELLHTASLIHDDVLDRASTRRGQPTLNSQLGSGAVIMIGDFLFAQSAILAAATGSTRVVSIFAGSLGDICDGQLREMMDAHRTEQNRTDYEKRIYGKTASLFAGAAEMGAVIGEAPEDHIQAIRQYGSDVGMAFQIIDDVLDVTQESDGIGKPAGNDLRQGTVTLPVMMYARDLMPGGDAQHTLNAVIRGEIEDSSAIDDVVHEIRASSAIEETIDAARIFIDQAKRQIEIIPDPQSRDLLAEIADLAIRRVS